MKSTASPYYPPRASWLSGLSGRCSGWGRAVRRAFRAVEVPQGVSWRGLVGSVLVPGLGLYLRGRVRLGRVAMGASGALVLIFFVWLGYPVSNLAFGLLLSVQVTSLLYYLEPVLEGTRLGYRVLLSFVLIAVLLTFVYLPCQRFLENHLFRPLSVRGHIVVIHPYSKTTVQRGEWVAYLLDGQFDRNIRLGSGLGLGPVLARPGDRVRFSETGFEVAGVVRRLAPGMPMEGEWCVPPETVMIWPDLDISGHGQVPTASVHSALQQLSMVSTQKLIGKPLKWWFFRRQVITP